MFTKTRRFALATAMLWLVFGAGGRAVADINISTPDGLTAGESFRIVFLTDGTTTATSSDINYYNRFVTNDARTEAGGVALYQGVQLTWTAIASTSAMSAISNVGTFGVPVYEVFENVGRLVASTDTTETGGLWSGMLISNISADLNGNDVLSTGVWTGTTPDGSQAIGNELGTSSPRWGDSGDGTSGWVDLGVDLISPMSPINMYAISQPLTVPSAVTVPEPSTLWMAAGGICAGAAFCWSRRRRQQRR